MAIQMGKTLAFTAVSGMVAGITGCASAPAAPTPEVPAAGAEPAAAAPDAAATEGKHGCKGQNECKGKGGCKTDKNECKGQNECKGKGGCKTMDAAPEAPAAPTP